MDISSKAEITRIHPMLAVSTVTTDAVPQSGRHEYRRWYDMRAVHNCSLQLVIRLRLADNDLLLLISFT